MSETGVYELKKADSYLSRLFLFWVMLPTILAIIPNFGLLYWFTIRMVELGGLEPPSKHRTSQLSTRLVSLWLSAADCRETGYPQLIL